MRRGDSRLRRAMLRWRTGFLLGLAGLLLSAGCQVDIDTGREGFPCNPDGTCLEGLACEEAVCVRPTIGCTGACAIPEGPLTLRVDPPVILADGVAAARVESEVVLGGEGRPVPDGTLFTVSTTLGAIVEADEDAGTAGHQLGTRAGALDFQVQGGTTPGTATITALALEGPASGTVTLGLADPDAAVPTGSIILTAVPAALEADGSSASLIGSNLILTLGGGPILDGTLFTVDTDRGGIGTPDAAASIAGLQVPSTGGRIAFSLIADTTVGDARVTAASVDGDATGETLVPFVAPGDESATGPITLRATPAMLTADGAATSNIVSDPIQNVAGNAVADGSLITVATDLGTLTDADEDPGIAGLQVSTSGGTIAFTLLAGTLPGTATLTAASVLGSASGQTSVELFGVPSGTESLIAASPQDLPGDGISVSTITLTLLDGGGAPVPARVILLESDFGTLGDTTDEGEGRYTANLRADAAGVATVSATLDGAAFGPTTTVTFGNLAPLISVNPPSFPAALVLDTIHFTATVTDPNPADSPAPPLWQVVSEPSPSSGSFLPLAPTATGLTASFVPAEAGTYVLEVSADDGVATGRTTVTIDVAAFDFVPYAPTNAAQKSIFAMDVDRNTGDLGLATSWGAIVYDTSTRDPLLCDAQGGTKYDVVWQPTTGNFVFVHGASTSPIHVVSAYDGSGCTVTAPAPLGSNLGTALAVAPSGDVWVGTNLGMHLLDPTWTTLDAPRIFDTGSLQGVEPSAMVFDHSGALFVAGQQGHYWRTPLPFDPTAPFVDLFVGGPDDIVNMSRGLLDPASGLDEIWMATGPNGLYVIPDAAGAPSVSVNYLQSFSGAPLANLRDLSFDETTGDLWVIGADGLYRYKRDLGELFFIASNTSGLCPAGWHVLVDSAAPSLRGRRIWVGCNNGLQLAQGAPLP